MKTIVVGIDGGAPSKHAAEEAVRLAEALEAKVHFVTVVRKREVTKVESGSDHWLVDNVDRAKEHVTEFLESVGAEIEYSVAGLTGQPADVLVSEAKQVDADLIVVGNADMATRSARFFGGVGSAILGRAPCNVLVVKTA